MQTNMSINSVQIIENGVIVQIMENGVVVQIMEIGTWELEIVF